METVEEVYDKIAHEFDKTRIFPWPHVKEYIDDLEKDSIVLDIGCGNGKNLFYRKDISCIGIDISQKMVDLVISRDGLAKKGTD
jgi:alkylated DNA repair protein alkB homolog 8